MLEVSQGLQYSESDIRTLSLRSINITGPCDCKLISQRELGSGRLALQLPGAEEEAWKGSMCRGGRGQRALSVAFGLWCCCLAFRSSLAPEPEKARYAVVAATTSQSNRRCPSPSILVLVLVLVVVVVVVVVASAFLAAERVRLATSL